MNKSKKYLGWSFEKSVNPFSKKPQITLSHDSGIYQIVATQESNGSWWGDLLVERHCSKTGRKSWEPCRNQPDVSSVPEMIQEAERRIAYLLKGV